MKNLFLILSLLLTASVSFAANIIVTTNSDAGPGSLRSAIASAANNDNILFDPGLASQTITLSSTLTIPAAKNLTIDGAGAAGLTISGNNAVRIFLLISTSVNPTTLTLKNLRLVNGKTIENGGAVRSQHQGILNISNCNFSSNNAALGGSAIYSDFEGKATIVNCTFSDNICISGNNESGSTVFLFGPATQTIKNCTFTNNKGINGGAIHGINAPLLIEDCNFTGNVTTDARFDTGQPQDFLRGFGGAIYTDRATTLAGTNVGSIILRRCKFENNKGRSEGGAAYLYTGVRDEVLIENCNFNNNEVLGLPGGPGANSSAGGAISQMNNSKNKGFVLRNSTFSNNKSIEGAGAVRVFYADTKIENCTFFNNQSTLIASNGYGSNGGALALSNVESSSVEITNSTFAQNSAGWVAGAIIGPSTVKLKNNIFLNNTTYTFGNNGYSLALHTSNEMTDLGGNLQYPVQPHPGDPNDCNISASVTIANANLLPLTDNGGYTATMALQAGSPAIDFGVNCTLPLDQRGVPRVGNCDAGAFEYAVVLPVSLVNFTVKPQGNSAMIEWTTAVEINSKYFEIEKSTDGLSFVKLTRIESKNGTGLSRYIAYDDRPATGVNYYKLIQYDIDGRASVAGVKTLKFKYNSSELVCYPNPTADGRVTVVMPDELAGHKKQLSLVNVSGKVILKVMLDSNSRRYLLNIPDTQKGVYFIHVEGGQRKFMSQVIFD